MRNADQFTFQKHLLNDAMHAWRFQPGSQEAQRQGGGWVLSASQVGQLHRAPHDYEGELPVPGDEPRLHQTDPAAGGGQVPHVILNKSPDTPWVSIWHPIF